MNIFTLQNVRKKRKGTYVVEIMALSFRPFFASENVQKKGKRTHYTLSELWHYRLGYISRGRIESLVKNEILPPLEFFDLEQCVDCVKGKYVKQIKEGAKRSTGTLEIIRTDICGCFPVKSMDGYDSIITFTDDYSR
jgi:hypothetical protein